jgi:hypothetical protein
VLEAWVSKVVADDEEVMPLLVVGLLIQEDEAENGVEELVVDSSVFDVMLSVRVWPLNTIQVIPPPGPHGTSERRGVALLEGTWVCVVPGPITIQLSAVLSAHELDPNWLED